MSPSSTCTPTPRTPPVVHFLWITSPLPCSLALSRRGEWRIRKRRSHVTALFPHEHTSRSTSLDNFAVAVYARFHQLGRVENLEEAITCHRQALALFPHGYPNPSTSLNNLATAMSTRFEQLWKMGIWRNQSHATVKHLFSKFMTIPVGHLLSINSPMLYPLASSNQGAKLIYWIQSSIFLKPRIYHQQGIHTNHQSDYRSLSFSSTV